MRDNAATQDLLSFEDLERYQNDGYVILREAFPRRDIDLMERCARRHLAEDSPRRVLESDGRTARAVHGMHLVDPFFAALSRHPTMLGVARQVLRGEIYVHQSKVNAKLAKRGDRWEWHQDYVFWQAEDGMELPNAVNVALYLTDATEENGALNLIAGSHAFGVISPIVAEEKPAGYESMPAWITNLTARLKYTVAQGDIDTLLVHERAVSATAKAASLLLFHPNLVHSSGENTSEEDRLLLMYSYNRCDNAPVLRGSARPDFLCNPASDSLSELSLGDWNDILSAEEVSRTA